MAETMYDVVVVGSGASGGWACKRLSEAGLKVALVDAGRPQSDKNFNEHEPRFRLPYRAMAGEVINRTRPIQKYFCSEFNYHWFANDLEEPYTTPEGMPFNWVGRLRVTGGRTNVWGRQSYRLSDLDFKAASHDGYGVDWPLSYKDIEPYYDLVEEYVGITGIKEGLPQLPDGKFQPPMGLRCCEAHFRETVKQKLGWAVTLGRSANLTRPINGRAACHYCGPCDRGCTTHSYFNAAFTTVADALRTGRTTHIPNAMVYQVLMDPETSKAKGVIYIDRVHRTMHRVQGRAVILCAQSQESVRILLNSASQRYPNGLANSSGVLGHYLMDHIWVGGGATGEFPDLPDTPGMNGPNRPTGIYVPRFRNLLTGPQQKEFIRGFGFQTWGDSAGPNLHAPGFGKAFQQAIMNPAAGRISLKGFGECLSRWENYVEIDPSVKDVFGIPVLRIHMKYGDNEMKMITDMANTAAEMMEASGAKNIQPYTVYDRRPGMGIHEVGIARMGDNPRTSVLNQFQQSHDVRNLFVMDGSGFPSTACQNPTITIMALAVRSCDHLLQEMKRGEV